MLIVTREGDRRWDFNDGLFRYRSRRLLPGGLFIFVRVAGEYHGLSEAAGPVDFFPQACPGLAVPRLVGRGWTAGR